jgi:hypothetical protein
MGAQHAAQTIHKFAEDLKLISTITNRCPSLRASVDAQSFRTARRMFNNYFPGSDKIRHATAHSGEYLYSEAGMRDHSLGQGSQFNNINGVTLMTAYRGRMLTLDISKETLERLDEIRRLVWNAHRPRVS